MSTILITGLLLNITLLYLIVFQSPATLSPYRFFLADTTITQICFSILFFFTQPRILSSGTTTVIINLGPIQFFNERQAVLTYFGSMHMAWNSFISIMLAMIYRYFSIKTRHLSTRSSVLACFFGFMFPFLNYLVCIQIKTSRDKHLIETLVGDVVPTVNLYNLVVSTDFAIQPEMIFFAANLSVSYIPLYVIMFWCRRQILKELNVTSSIQSAATKESVRKFVNALTIQSLCPLVSFFPAAISNGLSQLGFVESSLNSFFIAPCLSLSCVVDPIVSIYFIHPYRRYIQQIFAPQIEEAVVVQSIGTI